MTRFNIVAVVGNAGPTSRTKVLGQTISIALSSALADVLPIRLQTLEIAQLAPHIGAAASRAQLDAEGAAAIQAIEGADFIVAVAPVYKGSYSGLFKHLFDLVDHEALVGRPVLLAANGGSDRHALVVDHQLRPLFAFFRALTVPSAVYASESDFDGYAIKPGPLRTRIDEAVAQAVLLVGARARQELRLAA